MCRINIRSMNRNFNAFEQYLAGLRFEFAFIGVSETWLTDNNHDLFNLSGYTFIEQHRVRKTGGGVGLFLKDHIEYNLREDLISFCDIMESLFVKLPSTVFGMEKNIIIGIIYRPPGTDFNEFSDLLANTLDRIKKENKICYLLGDYNINLLNYDSHNATAEFADLLYANSFIPLINRPTRVSRFSATLIDNIFTNNFQNIHKSHQGILVTEISDHFPIFHINWNICDRNKDVYFVARKKHMTNRQDFISVAETNWEEIYQIQDTQPAFSLFHQKLSILYDKHFPKTRVKLKYNNKKPWLSDGLRNAIKQKNKLYIKSIKIKTAQNETRYKTYRNHLKRILYKAEKDYYSDLISPNKSNMKKNLVYFKRYHQQEKKFTNTIEIQIK